ncbi:dipeptidase [Shewanella baltica]|uniref:dipeptidase n=1 Tax=Shewanella baltica TaxID=62322 RepID=UPI00217CE2FB|nr:dipeptidase [Shewanella baltica]MCS6129784.1 dipeptidase [Shewanella baltica]MCS6141724.1 dipeptidase [Shewanella baltica]MCS6148058.1 dipeptidase [Shewanella baltica]MCS6172587.1 dipeptidase [Shewanella baltica]MCS6189811.1 dipeptidase [Shewanella baltica]
MSQSGIQHARVRRALSLALLTASSWVMPQCIAAPAPATTAANTIAPQLSPNALKVADYAVAKYDAAMVQSLTQLVSFNTQAVEGQTPDTNPAFVGFKSSLKQLSQDLGLDYADHGYVVLIGLDANSAVNNESKKLGIVTHGDVQPANPALWAQSPYLLDTQSEPGKLIGRGTEDDKGAIVTAMYAMKAIKDKHIKRDRRIELLVYLAEESDWEPLKTFLASYTPADMNITIDAEYPVVTAEKGWSKITFTVPNITISNIEAKAEASTQTPTLTAFSGGYFASQVPQQAEAEIEAVSPALLTKLQTRAAAQQGMKYRFENHCVDKLCNLHIFADGKAAHSSTPEDGVNAVTHLAALLSPELNDKPWPKTSASLTVAAMNELVGLGIYAEQFGDLAYKDDFMGPLTLAPTVVVQTQKGTEVTINLRRPVGKTPELLAQQAREALALWQDKHQVQLADIESYWGEPMVMKDAPQQQTLLDVFAHFTGIVNPKPVAIGGSTNSKLFPNALSFGPAMPGVEYTGHTEKEFITHKQFMLNLKMYTAAFIELSAVK